MRYLQWILAVILACTPAWAQEKDPDSDEPATEQTSDTGAGEEEPTPPPLRVTERVTVVGSPSLLPRIPGSAYVLEPVELERQKGGFDDIHRLLRQVPGVVIQEEEGFGLRPNIGMRGSGYERSSKITLMEDGVLIAPAPYAAPSAYYFPVAGRMESIEVRKGSSQIKYGPRTNGGVLNLNSTSIPYELALNTTASLGAHDTRKLHVNIGDSYRNVAWLFETYQIDSDGFKELDSGGTTGFDLEDYLGKIRFQTSPQSSVYQFLELKLGKGQQDGDETYLGLTDEDFRENGVRRYAASQVDNISWDHEQYQARHFLALPRGFDVTTTVYRNDFSRNWYKLQSILGASLSDIFSDPSAFEEHLEIARGATSGEDALKVRANNRSYRSQGIQSIVGFDAGMGGVEHEIELGVRYHVDDEDRFQHEDGFRMVGGTMRATSSGAPGSQSNRIGEASALALFVQDTFDWGRLTFLPGLRYENIELVRTDYAKDDPDRSAPTRVRTNALDVWIPGVGLTFRPRPDLHVFGGIHKGFAPPGPGSSEDTEAESSVNYELGLRRQSTGLSGELVFFYNDYSNLLGADTLSSGGTGEGNFFNGGEVRVTGLEAAANYDLAPSLGLKGSMPLKLSYSLTDAVFRNTFESEYEPWGDVEEGDQLPYLPRHQLFLGWGLEREAWQVGVNGSYNASMRTEAGRGPAPALGRTDSFFVVNASGEMGIAPRLRLFVNVQNLLDEIYIVARRPAGARPGLPRTVMAGMKFSLGQ